MRKRRLPIILAVLLTTGIIPLISCGLEKQVETPEFMIENLVISPAEVTPGENVTVTVDVTNVEEVEGDYEVVLKVSWPTSLPPALLDYYTEKKNVTIAAGTTETVSFSLLEVEPGDYTVDIGGLSSTFVVMGLRFYATVRDIEIGAAVDGGALLWDDLYGRTLAREFSMVTPENVMKFGLIHPARDRYDFSGADAIVDFAQAHDMRVRGHTLVWHSQLPTWLTEGSWTRDELIDILREHITTVVGHYRGRVVAWDVVNEAIDANGSLRDTIWLRGIGPEYIDMAFEWAHQADPDALLFYNDYGGEGLGQKSDAIYALAQDLLGRGVPIHGIGLQMHISLDWFPAPQDIATNMKRLAALGLDVHVTEMDVRIKGDPTEEDLATQARIYADIMKVCLSAENCSAFVLWGFADLHSWVPGFFPGWGAALIFDESYRPKPAYDALIDVLSGG